MWGGHPRPPFLNWGSTTGAKRPSSGNPQNQSKAGGQECPPHNGYEQNQAELRIWIQGVVRFPGLRSGGLRVNNDMVLRDLVGDVLRTLWAHKLRTFLTMFGIAWGIVSIVLMVAAGEGLRQGQEVQARNLGKDILIVFHGRSSSGMAYWQSGAGAK